MKKYTNVTDRMLCVEFEGTAQFLRRGQSVTNALKTKRVPDGILVEDLGGETPKAEVKTKTKRVKKEK